MLRGFDEGYEIPSYGVWISSKFSNRGLSALTLHHAFAFCKLNGIKILLLKVHPENVVAKKLYESLGFVKIGVDERNGNFIYHKKF
jgi:RimJ/RimL family protein N-acetyltransferase